MMTINTSTIATSLLFSSSRDSKATDNMVDISDELTQRMELKTKQSEINKKISIKSN